MGMKKKKRKKEIILILLLLAAAVAAAAVNCSFWSKQDCDRADSVREQGRRDLVVGGERKRKLAV